MNYDILMTAGIGLGVALGLGIIGTWAARVRTMQQVESATQEDFKESTTTERDRRQLAKQLTLTSWIITPIIALTAFIYWVGLDTIWSFILTWWQPIAFVVLAALSFVVVFYGRSRFSIFGKGEDEYLNNWYQRRKRTNIVMVFIGIVAFLVWYSGVYQTLIPTENRGEFIALAKAVGVTLLGGGLIGNAIFLRKVRRDWMTQYTFSKYVGAGALIYGFTLLV